MGGRYFCPGSCISKTSEALNFKKKNDFFSGKACSGCSCLLRRRVQPCKWSQSFLLKVFSRNISLYSSFPGKKTYLPPPKATPSSTEGPAPLPPASAAAGHLFSPMTPADQQCFCPPAPLLLLI